MKLIKHLLCATALLGVGTFMTATAAFAQPANEPIKIGVPMPPRPALSGSVSFTARNFSQTFATPGSCAPKMP